MWSLRGGGSRLGNPWFRGLGLRGLGFEGMKVQSWRTYPKNDSAMPDLKDTCELSWHATGQTKKCDEGPHPRPPTLETQV